MSASASNDWKGSAKYWEKLVAIYSAQYGSNRYSYIYLPLADAQANLGEVDKAIDTLEYGLALTPGSRAAKVLLAQLYYDTGQEGKAQKLLVEVVDRWPDVLAGVSLLCRIYEKQGDIKSAGAISRKVSYYYPDSPFVQKMADGYEKMIEKEAEALEVSAETEKDEETEDVFAADIMAQEAVLPPAPFDEPAPEPDNARNAGAIIGENRKAPVALDEPALEPDNARNAGAIIGEKRKAPVALDEPASEPDNARNAGAIIGENRKAPPAFFDEPAPEPDNVRNAGAIIEEKRKAPVALDEPALEPDNVRNAGTIIGEKRKALAALESMLERITMIRNEGMV